MAGGELEALWGEPEETVVLEWASAYASALEEGKKERDASHDDGESRLLWRPGKEIFFDEMRAEAVWMELGLGCAHLFVGNFTLGLRNTRLAQRRLERHFGEDDGEEFVARNGVGGVVGWMLLAEVAARVGVDMWGYRDGLLLKGVRRVALGGEGGMGVLEGCKREEVVQWMAEVARLRGSDGSVAGREWEALGRGAAPLQWECAIPPGWRLGLGGRRAK